MGACARTERADVQVGVVFKIFQYQKKVCLDNWLDIEAGRTKWIKNIKGQGEQLSWITRVQSSANVFCVIPFHKIKGVFRSPAKNQHKINYQYLQTNYTKLKYQWDYHLKNSRLLHSLKWWGKKIYSNAQTVSKFKCKIEHKICGKRLIISKQISTDH